MLKKEKGNKVEDFRRVTLAGTLCKVYAEILAGRLKEEMEEKGLIPENQTGFRKKGETMDNVYVNYLVNKNISRRGEKLVAL